jgi:YD repeat-containing protein
VFFAALEGVDALECDGVANCRTVSRTMGYDNWGNHTNTLYQGILSKTGDEYEEETVWAVDQTNWLHRPTTKIIKDFDGTELRRSWFYYDNNNSTVGQLGTRGLRTREEHDLGGGQGHANNPKTTVSYDPLGNRQSVTDPLGCITSWVYDGTKTFVTSEATCLANNASQATTTFEWDERWGVMLSETDANSNQTHFEYDDAGQLEKVFGPLDTSYRPFRKYAFSISPSRAEYNNIKTEQPIGHGENGTLQKYEYFDGLGRVWFEKSRGPNNADVARIFEYDSRNLLEKVSDSIQYVGSGTTFGDFTTYTHDPLGRPKQTLFPDGTSITTSYSPDGTSNLMVVEVTDQRGNAKRRLLDAYGRVTRVEEDNLEVGQPVTYVTEYTYNALGQLLTTKNHLGHVSTIEYDKLGRKTRHDDPDTGEWNFPEYDKAGNLKSHTDAKGQTVSFDYDLSGRIIRKTHRDAPVPFGSSPAAGSVSVPFIFSGTTADRVGRGKTALAPDGGIDGVFTVTIPAGFGDKTIRSLTLTRSSGGQWNTDPTTTQWVVGAAVPSGGALVNTDNGDVGFGVSTGTSFNIYAADDATFPLFTEGLTFDVQPRDGIFRWEQCCLGHDHRRRGASVRFLVPNFGAPGFQRDDVRSSRERKDRLGA